MSPHIPLDTTRSPNQRLIEQNDMDEELYARALTLQSLGSHRSKVVLAGGADVQNTSNLYIDTGLQFTVVAGVLYAFEAIIGFQTSGATTGIGFACAGPGTPEVFTALATWQLGVTGAHTRTRAVLSSYNAGPVSASSHAALHDHPCRIVGFVKETVGGLFRVRFRCEDVGQATYIRRGSSVEYW